MDNLTVGIPAYNEAPYIEQTIRSVLEGYDYIDRIIISDNASTDGTGEIIKRYARKYKKIEYYRQDKTVSMGMNVKSIYEKVDSRYFLYLGAHDLLSQNYFQAVTKALSTHPEANLVMTTHYSMDRDGTPREKILDPDAHRQILASENMTERIYAVLNDWHYCLLGENVVKMDWYRQCVVGVNFNNTINFDSAYAMMGVLGGNCVVVPEAAHYQRDVRGPETLEERNERYKNQHKVHERKINPRWYVPNAFWNTCQTYAPYACTKRLRRDMAVRCWQQFLAAFTDDEWKFLSLPGALEEYLARSGREIFIVGVNQYSLNFYSSMRDKLKISGVIDLDNAGWLAGRASRTMLILAIPDQAANYAAMGRLEDLGFTYLENYFLAFDFPSWREMLQQGQGR